MKCVAFLTVLSERFVVVSSVANRRWLSVAGDVFHWQFWWLKGKFCIFVGGLVGRHATEKPYRRNVSNKCHRTKNTDSFTRKNSRLNFLLTGRHAKKNELADRVVVIWKLLCKTHWDCATWKDSKKNASQTLTHLISLWQVNWYD